MSGWRIGKTETNDDDRSTTEIIRDIKHIMDAFESEIKAASVYDQAVAAYDDGDLGSCKAYCDELQVLAQKMWDELSNAENTTS